MEDKENKNNFIRNFEENVELLNKRNSLNRSRNLSRSKNKSMSKIDYKKLEGRLNKMKQYKFVEKYLSDTEL